MLAGMFVTYEDATYQVARIIGAPRGYAGQPKPPTTYELAPVDGGQWRYVKDPLAVDMPLTPACETCGRQAGHCPGAGTTSCQQASSRARDGSVETRGDGAPLTQESNLCNPPCSDPLCPCTQKPGHDAAAPTGSRDTLLGVASWRAGDDES